MRAFAAVFAALFWLSPIASAQDSRWTAPSGLWSIDYVSQGWTFADPLPEDLRYFARIMIPLNPPPNDQVRMCAVSEVELDQADDDPARVRSTGARMTAEVATGMYEDREQIVTGVASTDISGVGVADISALSANRRTTHLHRVFYLPRNGRVLFIDIDCIWSISLDPAKAAEMPAILATLTFTPETSP